MHLSKEKNNSVQYGDYDNESNSVDNLAANFEFYSNSVVNIIPIPQSELQDTLEAVAL